MPFKVIIFVINGAMLATAIKKKEKEEKCDVFVVFAFNFIKVKQ